MSSEGGGNIDKTIYEIEKRISNGIPKYNPDKIEFNLVENSISLQTPTGEKQLLHKF